MGNKKTWKKEEIDFLTKNYSNLGNTECANALNRPIDSISNMAHRLHLKLTKQKKHNILISAHNYNCGFNSNLFNDINADFAYVLGFLWADGFVSKNTNNIKVSCVLEDILEIEHVFQNTGTWLTYVCKYNNWRTQKVLSISDRKLKLFLEQNDYLIKSKTTPNKILEKIPQYLHKFFLLGLIDGDGCFYVHQKRHIKQFSITGTYEQDWGAIKQMFNTIGIDKIYILRRKSFKSSSSLIRITNKLDISKLGGFIYSNHNYGLKRKKEKYYDIMNLV